MKRVALPVVVVLWITACEPTPTDFEVPPPSEAISDAVHGTNGQMGNEHFFWLPPMVSQPYAFAGPFDASMSPIVEICEFNGTDCVSTVATYTMSTGPGSETVRVEPADEHYLVNWHTDEFDVEPGPTYRIRVAVAGTVLGYADIQLASTGKEVKNITTDDIIGLKDGRTLPVKFRIEEEAVFAVGTDGGTISAEEGTVVLNVPSGALGTATGITVQPFEDPAPDPRIVPGTAFDFQPDGTEFGTPAQLTLSYNEANLPPDVPESRLVILTEDAGVWLPVAGSVVDEVANTVTAPIDGFSGKAVGGGPLPPVLLSAGNDYTCALGSAGETYCWGDNFAGMLGDGTTTNSDVPVAVSGGLVFESVSSQNVHTCGLAAGGDAYCWGENYNGELGDGTVVPSRSVPVAVAGGHTFVQVSAGDAQSCGVTTAGAALCWGFNGDGGLGDGSNTDSSVPVAVSGGHAFTWVSAGWSFACGVTTTGQAYCWGRNNAGQLGDGTTTDRNAPVAVAGGHVFESVTTGFGHACGLTAEGAVHCWGENGSGQLGNGTTSSSSTPVSVSGAHVFQWVSAGREHTCAVTDGGQAYCWGENSNTGRVGDGTTTDRLVPTAVAGGIVFESVSAGWSHTCGLTPSRDAYCWGRNDLGGLGNGTLVHSSVPVPVSPPFGSGYTISPPPPLLVSAGRDHSCAITGANGAYCWGDNFAGVLGDGTTTPSPTPVPVTGGLSAASVSADNTNSCVLTTAGDGYCWGENFDGEVGDGSTTNTIVPVAVAGGHDFVSLGTGDSHSCGLTATGDAYCWGYNDTGALGDGTTTGRLTPVSVAGGHTFSWLSTAYLYSCGVTVGGDAYCWGDNTHGQLGNGTTTQSNVPVKVQGGHHFESVSAGFDHACGTTSTGAAYCWGRNNSGQLGDGGGTASATPVAVAGGLSFDWVSASANSALAGHTCAVTTAGEAYCWGENADGQLGEGTTTDSSVPVPVSGGLTFETVDAGMVHTCGMTPDRYAYCWGRNQNGQLGDGTTTDSSVPVPVGFPFAAPDPCAVVTFTDADLETAIRTILGIPTGPITGADAEGLTGFLIVGGLGITSLDGLQCFTNITALNAPDNQISDLSPISELTALESVFLRSNQISDLTPLSGLVNLTNVAIDDNPITDLTGLESLTAATNLDLRNSGQITDVTPLAGLTSLTRLIITNGSLGTAAPLASLTLMEDLTLTDAGITDLGFMTDMSSLRFVTLDGNPFTDLTPLDGLATLETLRIEDNQLSDLTPLAGLTGLTSLALYGGPQITDITPIGNLTNLTTLRMDQSEVGSSAAVLANLTQLEHLVFNHSDVADIGFVTAMPGLIDVSLRSNQIADASPLLSLAGLTFVDLLQNPVTCDDPDVVQLVATVATVLCNERPAADITAPADGASFADGDPVTFQGTGTDPEDGTLPGNLLAWSSDIDGPIGLGSPLTTSTLTPGVHEINFEVTDQSGATGSATITITVTGPPVPPAGAYAVGGSGFEGIDLSTNSVAGSFTKSLFSANSAAVTPDGSHIYLVGAIQSVGTVVVVRASDYAEVASIDVGVWANHVAITPDGALAYVSQSDGTTSQVTVIETATNTIVTTIPLSGNPIRVAVTPDGGRVLVADQYFPGALAVIETSGHTVLGTVTGFGGAVRGIAVDPTGTRAFVTASNAPTSELWTVDLTTLQLDGSVTVGRYSRGTAITPDGRWVYVADQASPDPGTVSVVSTETNAVVTTVEGLANPTQLASTPDGASVYVVQSGSIVQIEAGSKTTVATLTVDAVDIAMVPDAAPPPAPPTEWTALGGGFANTCGLTSTGGAYCWGFNGAGRLGNGSTADVSVPVTVRGGLAFQQVSAGSGSHGCGLTASGDVHCWGNNGSGQLGNETTTDSSVPVAVSSGGVSFQEVSAGGEHTCALTTDGDVHCWGRNGSGQLGDGSYSNSSGPVAVSAGGATFQSVTTGDNHSCAVTTVGTAYCWGSNNFGQLGIGTAAVDSNLPLAVAGGLTFQSIVAGGSANVCGVTPTGEAYCWGSNGQGQLGIGTNIDTDAPVVVSDPASGPVTWAAVLPGNAHTCGLTSVGTAYCWGGGFVGNGDTIPVAAPDPAGGPLLWSSLTSGGFHSCAVTATGEAYCWGSNGSGQLGIGTTLNASAPTRILEPS